jgi:hypothetical protein
LTQNPGRERLTVEQIKNALAVTIDNITETAAMLGVSRQTIHWYINKYPELQEKSRRGHIRMEKPVFCEPLKSAGCWGYTPLVHSLGPHFLMGRTQVNQEQAKLNVPFVGANAARQRQAMLEPGMVFAFEPNACIGNHRVNIGGTVIVTSTGCEELNHIPTSVTHKQ